MSSPPGAPELSRSDQLRTLATQVRPELHRYCSRLMGSVIDGEDVVQDTFERAFLALPDLAADTPLRPWLFRIAHNRALDLIRSRAIRMSEPIEAALEVVASHDDPVQRLLGQEALKTAVTHFAELSIFQRSAVILKDVLGESLHEIASLLDMSVDAVKGHLARGRARLKEVNARASPPATAVSPSAATSLYIKLFNQRDWDGLRALLADDVKLNQSSYPLRTGRDNVSMFFSIYARSPAVRMSAARLEGREVIAVFEAGDSAMPSYLMWLEWRDGRISFIHDYRHVRYVVTDAALQF